MRVHADLIRTHADPIRTHADLIRTHTDLIDSVPFLLEENLSNSLLIFDLTVNVARLTNIVYARF